MIIIRKHNTVKHIKMAICLLLLMRFLWKRNYEVLNLIQATSLRIYIIYAFITLINIIELKIVVINGILFVLPIIYPILSIFHGVWKFPRDGPQRVNAITYICVRRRREINVCKWNSGAVNYFQITRVNWFDLAYISLHGICLGGAF